jgi:hypothetical protein
LAYVYDPNINAIKDGFVHATGLNDEIDWQSVLPPVELEDNKSQVPHPPETRAFVNAVVASSRSNFDETFEQCLRFEPGFRES